MEQRSWPGFPAGGRRRRALVSPYFQQGSRRSKLLPHRFKAVEVGGMTHGDNHHGAQRTVSAGDVVLVDDVGTKGHLTRVDGGQQALAVGVRVAEV